MKTFRIRTVLVILAALALTLPLASLGDAQTKGTIKIASQSPLSGEQSALGEQIKLGTQLAIEQKKAAIEKLGFKVELVPYDDQAKPEVGVSNAKSLLSDKDILLVIGHLNSGVAIPSSEVYKDDNLAMVSPANTNPVVTDRNLPNVNRVCGRDDLQGPVGAQFAKDVKKAKKVYIIHDKTTYGQGVAEFFQTEAKKLGLEVLGFDGTEEKSNFDPIITPLKAKNPDLVYFGGIYNQAAVFLKQMREKGVKASFLGPDGMDSSEMVKIAGKAAVGASFTTVAGPPKAHPAAAQFAKDFKAKFKKDAESFGIYAYDATSVGLGAIEQAIKTAKGEKPTRKQVSEAVRETKNFKGVTGTITFDEKGDPVKAKYFIMEIVSDNPEKWNDNKVAKVLELAAPPLKK